MAEIMDDTTSGGYGNNATAEPNEVETEDADQSEKALVKEWCAKIQDTRKFREKTFKDIRKSQDFALYGADKEWRDDGKYTVPLLPRYINQAVSTLYAKNPTTTFKRRRRRPYKLWDGRDDTLKAAMALAQQNDQQSLALVNEILEVRKSDQMLDAMGETLEILWDYYLDEQGCNYKQQLKSLVRRVKTSKVGYINLGFQRIMEPRPMRNAEIIDCTSKIEAIEITLKKMQDGDEGIDELSAEYAQLQSNLEDLQNEQDMVVREGPVLDFYLADQVIVDRKCTHLKSLTGAEWIAVEFEYTPDQVLGIFGVDLEGQFTPYDKDGQPYRSGTDREHQCVRVWCVQDKVNQQYFAVADGYCEFLKEPATPDIKIDRFWSVFPVVFNETEHFDEIYPKSDVEQAMDIQREYNRSREALRQHRIAATPWWVEGRGLSPEEKSNISSRIPHAVVSLPALSNGEKVADILQAGPTPAIDPNLYEVEQHFNDLMRCVGYQEAQMGASSNATATETSIAQQSQSIAQADNSDDLDSVLTELARAAGQVMLLNLTKDTVIEIVGEGAVWPDAPETRQEASKELYLEAEAGSTGRQNTAAELANMERAMPFITQIPGINPKPIATKYLKLLGIDVDDGYADSVPSITAINQLLLQSAKASSDAAASAGGTGGPTAAAGAQPTGNPATDPNMQGAAGGQNAPSAPRSTPGGQPQY